MSDNSESPHQARSPAGRHRRITLPGLLWTWTRRTALRACGRYSDDEDQRASWEAGGVIAAHRRAADQWIKPEDHFEKRDVDGRDE